MKTNSSPRGLKLAGEAFGLLVGYLVLVYFLPGLPFVTSAYARWLPVALNVMVVTTLLHVLHHLFKPSPLHHVFNLGATLASFYSLYLFWSIFPFDFSAVGAPHLNDLVQLALLVALFGLVIATLVQFIALLVGSLGLSQSSCD